MLLDPQTLAETCVKAAQDTRGYDITVLDIGKLTIIGDYFVIISGRSTTHVKAIADHIQETLKEQGIPPLRREGYREGRWVLLDYGSVIVHVFVEEERVFYNLERLWGDAPVVSLQVGLQT
ncbi:MAG: ribosome silencing factor [Bacillota bacterium]